MANMLWIDITTITTQSGNINVFVCFYSAWNERFLD